MASKIKRIEMTVGIYDSYAVITRHQNGNATVRVPFVNWVNNTGSLDFENLYFDATDERTKVLTSDIFTDDPKEYGSLAEFLSYCCSDKGY